MGKFRAFGKGLRAGYSAKRADVLTNKAVKASKKGNYGPAGKARMRLEDAQENFKGTPKTTSGAAGMVVGKHHRKVGASAGLIGAGAYIHAKKQPVKPGSRAQNKHPQVRSMPGMDDNVSNVV